MNYSHKKVLRTITLLGFIFSLQVALTIYSNSSFLEQIVSTQSIGFFYAASSLITLIGIYITPLMITAFGSRRILSLYSLLTLLALILLVLVTNKYILLGALGLYLILGTLLYLTFDIIIEHFSKIDAVGKIRGYYLALVNLAYVLSPLATGFILGRFGFPVVFGLSACIVIVLFFTGLSIPNVLTKRSEYSLSVILKKIIRSKQLSAIFISNFILQFFYAWMVIYTPQYLHTVLGIPWGKLGLLFSVGLLAFVILQIPVGYIIDRWMPEKHMLLFGHGIMGISTIIFGSLVHVVNFLPLLIIFFMTRVGASIIEVSSDSYFFKSIDRDHTSMVSVFRMMYPVAYIIAPLCASLLFILGVSYQSFFIILGLVSIAGSIPLLFIKRTNTGY